MGIFVIIKNSRFHTNRLFFLLSLTTFGWQFSWFILFGFPDLLPVDLVIKIGYSFIIFLPIVYFNFAISFIGAKKEYVAIRIFYVIGLFFIYFLWMTRIFINGHYSNIWGYYPKAGVLHIFYIIFLFFLAGRGSYKTIGKFYNETNLFLKKQLKYVLVAFGLYFLAGIDFAVNYGFEIYPPGFVFISISLMIIAYAIIRHRLMDIEIIIRETAIFAGIFGFSIGLFMLAIIAGEQFLKPYIGDNRWIVPAFSLLLVTLVIRPVEKTIYNVAGRFLFRRKYEYQKTLQDAAEGMSKIRDPKKLLNLIVHIISAKLKLANAAVFLFDSRSSSYVLKASRGDIGDGLISLRSENALIMWLSEKKRPLALDDVLKWMNNFNQRRIPGSLKSDLFQIKDTMSTLHAALSVPCFFRDDLLGVLILGEKKNGDFFSQDDMDLFSALSNEAAIALKNSQLYFEIDRKAFELENLYKREHRLFMHSSVAFAAAIDARDPYTHGHSQRVTNISLVILDFMGAMDEIDKDAFFRHRLQITGVLHDIGKIGVPDDILHKPAQLTPEERKEIEKHPVLGAEIVSHIAGLKDLVGGIRYHHERYDGKGYPEGLKSDEIPLMARIISVADTYDAMTSDRPYRKGLPPLTARDEIQKNASAQFDPYVVAAFLKAFEQGKIE